MDSLSPIGHVPDYSQYPLFLRTASDQGPTDTPSPSASSVSHSSPPPFSPVTPPKKGDPDYVKRPENAFMLFRSKRAEEIALQRPPSPVENRFETVGNGGKKLSKRAKMRGKRQRQAELSKLISSQWRALSAEDRAHWDALAREKKREHAEKHPDYVFRPQKKEPKKRSGAQLKGKGKQKEELASEVPERRAESEHGQSPPNSHHYPRAASLPAPYPPPFAYTVVQMPRVAHGLPAVPQAQQLSIPQQQSPYPSDNFPSTTPPLSIALTSDFAPDYAPGFDYLPPTTSMPSSQLSQDGAETIQVRNCHIHQPHGAGPSDHGYHPQTSEFLRSMFDLSGLTSTELDSFHALASGSSQGASQDPVVQSAMAASPSAPSPESSVGPTSPYPLQQAPDAVSQGSQPTYSFQPQNDLDFSQYLWDNELSAYPQLQASPYWLTPMDEDPFSPQTASIIPPEAIGITEEFSSPSPQQVGSPASTENSPVTVNPEMLSLGQTGLHGEQH
jgi:hypothetical protein